MPKTFTIQRTFDAPLRTLWWCWADPNLLGKWSGPKGFTAKVHKHELRAGGILHSCLTSAEGHEMWAKCVYRDVKASSHLSWDHSFSDKDGNITRHPASASWPLKLLTTVDLKDINGKTELTLTWVPIDATAEEIKTFEDGMDGMHQGWTGSFDQLDAFLATFDKTLPISCGNSPVKVKLEAEKTYSFCPCGLSATQPFCDGAHKKSESGMRSHKFTVEKSGTYWLCMCKQTSTRPFCDSTHKILAE